MPRMQRTTWIAVLAAGLLVGCGWTNNQKQGVAIAATQGFEKGLAKQGKTVDPKALDAWGRCFADKVAHHWKSYDDYREHQGDPAAAEMQKTCADQTKLFDAITEKK